MMKTLHHYRILTLALLWAMASSGSAQNTPRRGTMGDRPYMSQMASARSVIEVLIDGRSTGLCSFFRDRDYCTSIQHTLDSLAAQWGKVTDEQFSVGGEIDGPDNLMRVTIMHSDRKPSAQVVLHYAPSDVSCQILRFDVVPTGSIVFDEADLPPIEEPPPAQQELEEMPKR